MRTVVIIEPHPLFRLGLRQLLSDAIPQISVRDYDPSCLAESAPQAAEACDLLLLSLYESEDASQLASAAEKKFRPRHMLLLGEEQHLPSPEISLPECVAGVVARLACPEVLKASVTLVAAGGTCFPARWTPKAVHPDGHKPKVCDPLETPGNYQPTRWPAPAPSEAAPVTVETSRPQGTPAAPEGMDVEFNTPIKPGSAAHKESQLLGLTPRQYEVLVLLARGYPMKKVGRALNISVATAKAHTETLYQRLDVHNRNAAVYAAVSRGATLGWAHRLSSQQRVGSN